MISKNKLKEYSQYKVAKFCDENGVFVVEGDKLAKEALASDYEIEAVCAIEAWFVENRTLIRKKVNPENIYEVAQADLERISGMKSPNRVWMLVKRKEFQIVNASENNLTVVLDKIQDPGNMGTIVRICDWFGIRNIVCSPDTASIYNSKVVQATMGGVFRINMEYTNLDTFIEGCLEEKIPVFGAVLGGENVYTATLPNKAVLIIGNESKGISQNLIDKITNKIQIPNIGGTCESLNASVATGILCSEFARRVAL
jgi:TrmH family RNA methyltransferase